MTKINLSDKEKLKLIEAVNKGVEPAPDLLPKLFPGMAEKFDVKALDRAKIPTLEYAGKRQRRRFWRKAEQVLAPHHFRSCAVLAMQRVMSGKT